MAVSDVEQGVVGLDDVLRRQAKDRRQPLLCGRRRSTRGLARRPRGRRGRQQDRGQGEEGRREPGAHHPGSLAIARALLCGLVLGLGACATQPPAPPPPPPERPAPPPDPASLPCDAIARIEVRKSARTLVAFCTGGGERSWVVALGRSPIGPKRTRGDERTPEGEYRVVGAARPSRFHRFLPFDYPSPADAAAALAEGRLDADTHDAIVRARDELRLPPQHTPLGGLLGFHGEGRRWRGDSEQLDWTSGCIAMTDERIDFLAERTAPGTAVVIFP